MVCFKLFFRSYKYLFSINSMALKDGDAFQSRKQKKTPEEKNISQQMNAII
jgi:hypothetical protein